MYIRGLKKEVFYLIITLIFVLILSVCGLLFLINRSKEDNEKKTFRKEVKTVLKLAKSNCESEIKEGLSHTSTYVFSDNKLDILNKEYESIKEGLIIANSKCEITMRLYSENYMAYKDESSLLYVDDKEYSTCTTTDKDLEIGSIIKCDTEKFNVVDITDDTVSMLSMYNVDPKRNVQDSSETNPIAFDLINNRKVQTNTYCSSSLYGCNIYEKYDGIFTNGDFEGTIVEDSTIKPYVDSYALKLNFGHNLISDSLITTDVLEKLGCSMLDNTCLNSKYVFVYNTSYWTKTYFSGSPSIVWHVLSTGVFSGAYANYDNFSGVRPYITIKKDVIKYSKETE